ncbi:MAG: alpha/beta hydrolase [Desulfobacterales bacterium]|nr:alpha/beta hydrolase [Desulfobacterales bacterium]
MKISEKNIEFYADNILIKGVLHLPILQAKTKNLPIVIGSHGLEGSKDSAKQIILSKLLPQNNIGFLRFDHRGCGESKGDFLNDTSVPNRASDFINAVRYILQIEGADRKIGIFGSSLGGSTCIEAWDTLKQMDIELAGCVLCATPVKSRTIENIPVHEQLDNHQQALPMSFFLENLNFDLSEKIKKMTHVLIFHGQADEVVPIENAHTIYKNSKDPKKIILFKDGDHQTSSRKDQEIFEKETLKWFKATLF